MDKLNFTGKLYLIPTTLGEIEPLNVLPLSVKKLVENLDTYVVENEKSARRFIKSISPNTVQSKLQIKIIQKFSADPQLPVFLKDAWQKGIHIGLLSEAGCPAVADPGANVVGLAHGLGVQVVPIVGPSAIVLALMASGMNGQNFAFNGYLPVDKTKLKIVLKKLESKVLSENQTQIFMETPYRNNNFLKELIQTLHPQMLLCVAADITLPTEWIRTDSVSNWKKNTENLHKRPAIFLIYHNK
ncbi:MAG: SAM-dependent methyltransferase [Flavobacteriales bacterium CG_4_9_14_3_um_filter_40_17]|nr:MAG: SAM-dependent methyltransferase [Flavobacteriales bacterium CG_4_9_14_3_um_filter_40_17]